MTPGRPSVDAQVRYRDMMTGKLHEARLQVGAAAPSRREMVSINQTINNYGDGAVLSQAARDSIVKHVHTGAGRAELRQVFDELRAAIGDVVDDEEDRQVRIETIDDLERELNAETPRKTWVQKFWNGAIWAATVEGAIQGGERVGRALVALRPYVQPWFEELPPIPPELLGAMA